MADDRDGLERHELFQPLDQEGHGRRLIGGRHRTLLATAIGDFHDESGTRHPDPLDRARDEPLRPIT